jgi:hypothetical protein
VTLNPPPALARWLAVMVSVVSAPLFQGCMTPLKEVSYYKPTVADPQARAMPWGYGLAVAAQGICLHVVDGSREGEPLLAPSQPLPAGSGDFVKLIVWLVPEWQQRGHTFRPSGISVQFDDGRASKPAAIQVSRFRTKWDKEKAYLLRQDAEETIYARQHLGPTSVEGADEPIELWDLTRVMVTFVKPAGTSVPRSISITGIARDAAAVEVAQIRLSHEKNVDWVTGFIPTDYKGCRALQAALGAPNPDKERAESGMPLEATPLAQGRSAVPKAGTGVAAGSITYSGPRGVYAISVRRLDSGDWHEIRVGAVDHPLSAPLLLIKGDFPQTAGELFAVELPPGAYEIYSWRFASRCGMPTAASPFSLRFTVTPGETVYLGSVEFSGLCTSSSYLEHFRADYRNRLDRDLPLLRRKYPALGERIAAPPEGGMTIDRLGSRPLPEVRFLTPDVGR